MAHQRCDIDENALMDLLGRGCTTKEIAEVFDTSSAVISRRTTALQRKQGVLLQYRSVQSLELTEIQMKILQAITPDKIAEAPLRDLILAYKILKDKEHLIEGKPTELKGLIGYLLQIEKEEADNQFKTGAIDVDSVSNTLSSDGYIQDDEEDFNLEEDAFTNPDWTPNL